MPGFPSHNMRLSEINAAIYIEQLKKLDSYAWYFRKIYKLMANKLSSVPSLTLQKVLNPEGSIPQSIYIVLKSHEMAVRLGEFLCGIGVYAKTIYCLNEAPSSIFLYWPCVLEKIGFVGEKNNNKYSKTTDLLGRTVSITFGLDISEEIIGKVSDEIVLFCEG